MLSLFYMDSTFKKYERLKSSLAIQDLLKQGQILSSFPLKIYWSIFAGSDQKSPVRVAISVPKKKFRRAVDRNLLKRRIRESYRQNKHGLHESLISSGCEVNMLILYLADEFSPYAEIDEKLKILLSKLILNIEKCA